MFKEGQRVRGIENVQKAGTIKSILNNGILEIVWDNHDVEIINQSEVRADVLARTAWDQLGEGEFSDFRNFTISSIINKVYNANANTISTLKASKTIFKPYQFIPLLKLLNSVHNRIIIADEVGLGKTISAGHIILELSARRQLNNLLVVCLNSIQEKWIDELYNKFNIRLRRFEHLREFKRALSNFEESGENIMGIINYDKFRRVKELEFFQQAAIKFDLLIFDEAHRLRNETNTRKALKPFAEMAQAIVMLTATPIMTGLENLYNLITFLDKDQFSNYEIFQNTININKPFLRAYKQLNQGVSIQEIIAGLENATVEQLFKYVEIYRSVVPLPEAMKGDPLFQKLMNELKGITTLTAQKKVEIQEMLINLNSLNHFYTRSRKRDVSIGEDVVHRNSNVIEIEMNESEKSIYLNIMNSVDESNLGAIQIMRKYSSSLFAHEYSEESLLNRDYIINEEDGKFSALLEIIEQENKPIIVFSFFKKTLFYLSKRLAAEGMNSQVIHGGIELDQRNEVLQRFEKGEFKVLLSSEVGSTGLDMQFCDRLVNYDLPWNPMVVEQRIGRIDRIGQKSNVINIFSLIYKDTIEERICTRLYRRIRIFEEAIGDLEEILGERDDYIEGEIQKLYKLKLTKEQIDQRLDNIAVAFERTKLDLKKIEEGLTDTYSNDLYFNNEVERIEKNKKYITENDLLEFVNRLITNKLTSVTFIQSPNDRFVYELKQPKHNLLFDFIELNMDQENAELKQIYRVFKTKNFSHKISFTFNQEYAFKHKNIEYINAYHPLVNAASNYFRNNQLDRNSVFRFAIKRDNLSDSLKSVLSNNFYFLVKYEIEVKKSINGRITNFSYLKSVLIDLESEIFDVCDREISEEFTMSCQQNITATPEEGIIPFNKELMQELKYKYSEYVLEEKEIFASKERIIFKSELERKTKSERQDLMKRLERLYERLEKREGIEKILINDIKKLETRLEMLDRAEENSSIGFNNKLISLNVVYIYD